MSEKTILTKEAFLTELQTSLEELLGEGYCLKCCKTEKINGVVRDTLLVQRSGFDCAPSFYAEELYRSYQEGSQIAMIAEQLRELIQRETADKKSIAAEISSKEWVEEHIFVRLIGSRKNEELLNHSIYVPVEDLAAVYYVLTEQGEDGIRSYRLPKTIWEKAELGEPAAYFQHAIENTRRLFPEEVIPMSQFLSLLVKKQGDEGTDLSLEPDSGMGTELLILSNRSKINGAAVILYPDFLKELSGRYGSFYLIPSSVHEVLLVRQEAGREEELNQMVKEVNTTQVDPEEVLSDHIYYYSEETGLCAR